MDRKCLLPIGLSKLEIQVFAKTLRCSQDSEEFSS